MQPVPKSTPEPLIPLSSLEDMDSIHMPALPDARTGAEGALQ